MLKRTCTYFEGNGNFRFHKLSFVSAKHFHFLAAIFSLYIFKLSGVSATSEDASRQSANIKISYSNNLSSHFPHQLAPQQYVVYCNTWKMSIWAKFLLLASNGINNSPFPKFIAVEIFYFLIFYTLSPPPHTHMKKRKNSTRFFHFFCILFSTKLCQHTISTHFTHERLLADKRKVFPWNMMKILNSFSSSHPHIFFLSFFSFYELVTL